MVDFCDWVAFQVLGRFDVAFSRPIHSKTFVTCVEEDKMLSAGGFMARLVDFL